ncbi:hypothetical protein HPB50_017811 [Hyalomma asiaticum]|uniref:Uncharacterized protein n=1 Tax=Hyalomma asiaticum TaxID=266040 RepID=A0ACB7S7J7_HYAAI|nr:hypothetical protein HPB50_017811 [Hyalomma asiaticum]
MSGMRGRALEAFLSATQCSLEVDDVKKIQLYYGNIDASLQEIKLAFQWLGRNIPKDYRKNAANYALRVVQCCIHALEVEKHPRVSDLVAVLNTLIKIVEVRFLRTEIASAVDVGYEAFRIALSVHYTSMLLKILPYLAQTLLYSKNHSKCREVLSHLRHVAEVAEDTVGMALYYGGLAELLVHQCETSSCGLDQSCKEWLRRAKELKRSFHWRSSYWGRRAQRHLSEIKWK